MRYTRFGEKDPNASTVCFDAVGARTLWLGAAGAGSRLKLVTNNWILGLLRNLAETIALARALGVDPAQFLGAIDSGHGEEDMAAIYEAVKRNRG